MRFHLLVSTATAFVAAGGMIVALRSLDNLSPNLFNAANCQFCSHTIVFFTLIIEAIGIWMHSVHENSETFIFKLVAVLFAFSGTLGLFSMAMEMLPVA